MIEEFMMTKKIFNILTVLSIGLCSCSSSFASDEISLDMTGFKQTRLDILTDDVSSNDLPTGENNSKDKFSEIDLSDLELSEDDFQSINLNITSPIVIEKQKEATVSQSTDSNEISEDKVSLKEKLEMLSMILQELTFKEKVAFLYDLIREPVVDGSVAAKDHVVSNKKKYIAGGSAVFALGALLYFKSVGNK